MNIYDFIKNNSTLAMVILIAMLNLVGISYNYTMFAKFGYNYADFAETSDFLIAALKNPFALVYSTISIFIIFPAISILSVRIINRWLSIKYTYYFNHMIIVGIINVIVILLLIPGYIAHLVGGVSTRGSPWLSILLGPSPVVSLTCETIDGGVKKNAPFTGKLVAEAGDFFLISSDSTNLMVRKDCVQVMKQLESMTTGGPAHQG